jgi:hypothetical protein
MPSKVPNSVVEGVLRQVLTGEGFELTPARRHGETGVDILAKRHDEAIYVECIGYKARGPARAKDFYESFFRATSRLNHGAVRIAVAVAAQARVGLPARARQHAVAWERLAAAFPELEIWLVDTEARSYSRHTWIEWLQTGELGAAGDQSSDSA